MNAGARPGGLLERDGEIAALVGALDDARRGSGSVVVVEGPAGIGKSRLLQTARAEAERDGMVVLRATGAELERDSPFGVTVELFGRALAKAGRGERERLLAGSAQLAGSLLEDSSWPVVEPPAVVRSVFWLAVNLCERGPLAIVLDDAQWADEPSLMFLAYLAARIRELSIGLLLAVRSGEPESAGHALGTVLAEAMRLAPAGLSDRAVGELVGQELPGSEPEFAAACARATAGNPFLARELARALRDDEVTPTAASVERVEALVPASVLHSVLTRLARLGPAAREVAAAVAVLGDGAMLRHVVRLTGIDAEDAARGADALAKAVILVPGEPLGFSHPLIASAVRTDMGAFARAQRHRRAAELLDAEGASVAEVAAHLLLSSPEGSPQTVTTLRDAAARARTRGDPGAAARLLARALAEPPAVQDRAGVLLALAQAEAQAADPAAEHHAVEALELAGAQAQDRVPALRVLSQVHVALGRREPAAQALGEALAATDPDGPEGQDVLAQYLTTHRFSTSLWPDTQARLAPMLDAARQGRAPEHPGVGAHVVLELALRGERATVVRSLAAQVSAAPAAVDPAAHGMVLGMLVQALCVIDELDAAERIAESALSAARAQGSFMSRAAGHFHRAIVRCHHGALADGLADLDRAQVPYREGWSAGAPWPQSLQAQVHLERGELDEARRVVTLTWRDCPPSPESMDHAIGLFARARLRLAEGNPAGALTDAEVAGRSLAEGFGIDHSGLVPWRRTAALAALALGERDRARALADRQLERARELGVARAVGIALRTAAAMAEGVGQLALLTEAVEILQTSPSRLERGHALADLGRALVRAGRRRDAQVPLRAALALADEMGATALVQSVGQDLRASGARPRRAAITGVPALTAAERRVCRLAARGLTNRQIAQELYVSTKTVQTHLAHAYRKLEIDSRRQLPPTLAEDSPP